jgi:hypothetical protein
MTITIAHVLNQPISVASVAHEEFKVVFAKFKKHLKKFASTGIITLAEDEAESSKVMFSFIDREYEVSLTTAYIDNNVFQGKVSMRRRAENSPEIGCVTFNSRKSRITEPLTKAEGSLVEAHFCRIVVYAWLLKDIGWDINQLTSNLNSSENSHFVVEEETNENMDEVDAKPMVKSKHSHATQDKTDSSSLEN